MSKSNGARSRASQVPEPAARTAAVNASRLAAAGLALFLAFGYGGVAEADSGRADGGHQGFGPDTASGADVPEQAGGEPAVVAMISAASSDSATEETVVVTSAHGVVTKTTTITPAVDAGGMFAVRTSTVAPAAALGVQGGVATKNRPAALVLPQTGAAETLSMQAGAGVLMVIAGATILRGRRRESHS